MEDLKAEKFVTACFVWVLIFGIGFLAEVDRSPRVLVSKARVGKCLAMY